MTPQAFVQQLTQELQACPVNNNQFYKRFRDTVLTTQQLRRFALQYFWFCQQFTTRVLVGLIYNTPAWQEDVRMELVKTLYSEMGYGKSDAVHLNLLKKFMVALGVTNDDLKIITPIPEVKTYINELDALFTNGEFRQALGAEFGVENTAATEFTFLAPGIKQYPQFSSIDISFFTFHLIEEQNHSDWLGKCIALIALTPDDQTEIRKGALKTAELWGNFWEGMDRYVFDAS